MTRDLDATLRRLVDLSMQFRVLTKRMGALLSTDMADADDSAMWEVLDMLERQLTEVVEVWNQAIALLEQRD